MQHVYELMSDCLCVTPSEPPFARDRGEGPVQTPAGEGRFGSARTRVRMGARVKPMGVPSRSSLHTADCAASSSARMESISSPPAPAPTTAAFVFFFPMVDRATLRHLVM